MVFHLGKRLNCLKITCSVSMAWRSDNTVVIAAGLLHISKNMMAIQAIRAYLGALCGHAEGEK